MTVPAQATSLPRIVRSWPRTLGLAGTTVLFAGATWALVELQRGAPTALSETVWVGALSLSSLALTALWHAVGRTGRAACAGCGRRLTGLHTRGRALVGCGGCHRYYQTARGELTPVEESHVSGAPLFAAPLDGHPLWPGGCCVCGAPHARTRRLADDVDVPHCAAHDDGASLRPGPGSMRILFRSYGYQRRFVRLNAAPTGTAPRID
jgi:hypothetical protein